MWAIRLGKLTHKNAALGGGKISAKTYKDCTHCPKESFEKVGDIPALVHLRHHPQHYHSPLDRIPAVSAPGGLGLPWAAEKGGENTFRSFHPFRVPSTGKAVTIAPRRSLEWRETYLRCYISDFDHIIISLHRP